MIIHITERKEEERREGQRLVSEGKRRECAAAEE